MSRRRRDGDVAACLAPPDTSVSEVRDVHCQGQGQLYITCMMGGSGSQAVAASDRQRGRGQSPENFVSHTFRCAGFDG